MKEKAEAEDENENEDDGCRQDRAAATDRRLFRAETEPFFIISRHGLAL